MRDRTDFFFMAAAMTMALIPAACSSGDTSEASLQNSETTAEDGDAAGGAVEPAQADGAVDTLPPTVSERTAVADTPNPVTLEAVTDEFGEIPAAGSPGLTSEAACELLPLGHLAPMLGDQPLPTGFGGCSLLVLSKGYDLRIERLPAAAIEAIDTMPPPREAVTIAVGDVPVTGAFINGEASDANGPQLVIGTADHTWHLTQHLNTEAGGQPLAPNQLVEIGRVVVARFGTNGPEGSAATAEVNTETETEAEGETSSQAPIDGAATALSAEDSASLGEWILAFRAAQNAVVDREAEVEILQQFMTDEEWARTPPGYADIQIRRESSRWIAETRDDPTLGSVVILKDCLNEFYSVLEPDVPSSVATEIFVLERSNGSNGSWGIVSSEFGEPDCADLGS